MAAHDWGRRTGGGHGLERLTTLPLHSRNDRWQTSPTAAAPLSALVATRFKRPSWFRSWLVCVTDSRGFGHIGGCLGGARTQARSMSIKLHERQVTRHIAFSERINNSVQEHGSLPVTHQILQTSLTKSTESFFFAGLPSPHRHEIHAFSPLNLGNNHKP